MEARLSALCRKLIAIRSVNTEGTRQIAEFCAREILAAAGIAARLIPSRREGPRQVNLLVFVEGREHALGPLVLNTHLDTVPPGELSLWTECGGDPFSATLNGERIYGLGAADTKPDFVAKATALIEIGKPPRCLSGRNVRRKARTYRCKRASRIGVKSGCTEAGVYALAGLVPVVFGPGPSTGVIHAPNEYNFPAEVEEAAVRFYRALLGS